MTVAGAVEFWCLRHAESLWNAEGRLQGQTDVPLSFWGRQQARFWARRLQAVPGGFTAVATSDLRRAAETAWCLAEELRLPLLLEPRLRERAAGSLEGRTWQSIADLLGVQAPAAGEGILDLGTHPGVEPMTAVAARAKEALCRLAECIEAGRLLVVVHGSWLAAFSERIRQPAGHWLANGHVRRFAYRSGHFSFLGDLDLQASFPEHPGGPEERQEMAIPIP